MHVAIDMKNMALHGGGIAALMRPLVAGFVAQRPDIDVSLVAPPFDTSLVEGCRNWRHVEIAWPERLPRPLRHPVYDTILFPRTIARLRPDLVVSFYHDVLLPARASGIRSVMAIHDTCIEDLPGVYPARIRRYYMAMLRLNLRRAAYVLTGTETSRADVMVRYGVPEDRIGIVPSAFDETPAEDDVAARAAALRAGQAGTRVVLYAGGSEYRKNVGRLVDAIAVLRREGRDVRLVTTGGRDDGWARALASRDPADAAAVGFLGRLSVPDLAAWYAAADAVAYPTLCEGFGRVLLEAMAAGAPLACSDLPVLREVAGDYPHYFDPRDVGAMAAVIAAALDAPRPAPRRDARYTEARAVSAFLAIMDGLTDDLAERF